MIKKIMLFFIIAIALGWTISATQTINYNFNTNGSDIFYAHPEAIKGSSILQIYTDKTNQVCRYDEDGNTNFNQMEKEFNLNYQLLHRLILENLEDGLYTYHIRCKGDDGIVSNELKFMFNIQNPVRAEIKLSKNSPANAGLIEVSLITTKSLSQKPSLSYSLDGSNYDIIPLSGREDEWTGYIIIPSTTGEAVGSFKFRGVDLEGNTGDEITEGDIFLVDTINPSTADSLIATGLPDRVKLEWRMSEEVESFNIYRSTYQGVDFSDYYQKTSSKSYVDSNVEKGKTYHYRINAVDEAGNEGGLSYEVFATVLRSDSAANISGNVDEGLSSELRGNVDSFLYEIEGVMNNIVNAKAKYNEDSKEYEIRNILKLNVVMEGAENELNNLEKEVEEYKKQSLTRLELEKKINNAKLRLNIMKKKIPESISILNEQSFDKKPSETEISELMMSLNGGQLSDNDLLKVKKSIEFIEKYQFSVKTYIYGLEISYLDGTTIRNTLVKEDIKSNTEKDENLSIVESIPKEVAQKSSDVSFKNSNYEVLKDDPVISFGYDNKQIIYTLNGVVNMDDAKRIGTFLIYDAEIQNNDGNKITGFFTFADVKSNGAFGLIVLGAIVLVLFFYMFFYKRKKGNLSALNQIVDKIIEAEVYVKNKDKEKSNTIYLEISGLYKGLKDKEKKKIYPEIERLYKMIKGI